MVFFDFLGKFFDLRSLSNLVVVSALGGLGVDGVLILGEACLRIFGIFRIFESV